MIFGAHLIVYSTDAAADRAFFRDVLGWEAVDVGQGWLIFAAPPTEVAVHPADDPSNELYLMCDDLYSEMRTLEAKGVHFSEVESARWGSSARFLIPGGAEVGLYQPSHPTALGT
jgi:hypothetical protein